MRFTDMAQEVCALEDQLKALCVVALDTDECEMLTAYYERIRG